jgi:dienelactone hydrolase
MTAVLDGWVDGTFGHDGLVRATYRKGSGPAVIVIHEIPGITPAVIRFAEDVVGGGFTVVMPLLVGEAGRDMSAPYIARSIAKVCVAKEFTTWARNQTSPIVGWLTALARQLQAECGGPGVGAVGMCFSGGFALAMLVDDATVAPVCSQPSLPFAVGTDRRSDLNLSPEDLARVRERVHGGCEVLALQFEGDRAVGDRLGAMRRALGPNVLTVELAPPAGVKRPHSVLTEHRDEPSVDRVLAFLRAKLR